ncbi:DUF5693 family protein [Thermatribacter velox]|uniref:DUF5693 family protein n=1 Tax=Thermatribacter velox TaxID=3039681 RepID=A0ABZ2YBT2_9BACT
MRSVENKRLLLGWLLLILTLLFSLPLLGVRIRDELSRKKVELVVDFNDVTYLAGITGTNVFSLLQELKKQGFQTVGVSEPSFKDLRDRGLIQLIQFPDGEDGLRYFRVSSADLAQRIERQLLLLGKKVRVVDTHVLGSNVFPEEEERLGTGFDVELLAQLKEEGYGVIFRPRNWPFFPADNLKRYLQEEFWGLGKGVIFSGEEVLGFGSSENLNSVVEFFQKRSLYWGYLEFVGQRGELYLAHSLPYSSVVRVHSIPLEELKRYTPPEAVERFLRAVKERSVGVLYVRFFRDLAPRPLEQNLEYLSKLRSSLLKAGFELGSAGTPRDFRVSYPLLFVFCGLVSVVASLVFWFFFPRGFWLGLPVLGFLCLVVARSWLQGVTLLGMLAGVFCPALPVLFLMDPALKHRPFLLKLLTAFGLAFAGGFIVASTLYNPLFVLRIEQYQGVKVSLLVPLFIIVLYYFRAGLSGVTLEQVFLGRLRRVELFLAGLFAVGFAFYLFRSGNFPLLPASDLELKMRLVLEKLLFARPRTKEFLVGYPALWLVWWLQKREILPVYRLGLWIAVGIGFTTFFNSFCHLHTPFLFTLLRFFNALLLSFPVFAVYFLVLKFFLWVWDYIKSWGE